MAARKGRRPEEFPQGPGCDMSSWETTMRYLDSEAKAGHFKGHNSALRVLSYLARHSWRRQPNKESMPIGGVMTGKSNYQRIADELSMSKSTVQRSMDWLRDEHWLITFEDERDKYGHRPSLRIVLLLDTTGNMKRQDRRSVLDEATRIITEASASQ